jgi:acyl-CoA reductase-like NAD-dependent aldehyde dehydrogenase
MAEVVTFFGALADYRKGGVEIIDDDPRNYVFSNVFEVAAKAAPHERVAVGKNFEYVIESARAEGTSGWSTCAHDEFVLCMDGTVEVHLLKLADPDAHVDPESEGAVAIPGDMPEGRKMGRIVLGRGHMALLPVGAAYRFHVGAPAAHERGRLLMKLADRIEEEAAELARLEAIDTGHPIRDCLALDVPRTALCFRYFGGMADKLEGSVIPVDAGFLNYVEREPIGVVGAIVPWNFPLMFTSWKMGPALAAGNTVVIKPSEITPMSTLRIGELMMEVGIPAGVVNIVTGYGHTAGQRIAGSRLHLQRVLSCVDVAKDEGGQIVTGGKVPEGAAFANGCFIEPAIVRASPADRVAREEVFGPFVTVLTFKDDAEALAIANGTDYGLGSGLWTRDLTRAHRFAKQLHAGMVWISSYKRVHPASPFGGVGMSGYGREMGFEAMREYTQAKSVWINVDAQIPPFYKR